MIFLTDKIRSHIAVNLLLNFLAEEVSMDDPRIIS
jgi:hypothetical protein